MPISAKYLLIGSTEAYSGKSSTVLGLAHQLQKKGLDISYGKPVGSNFREDKGQVGEADVEFIKQILALLPNRLLPTLLNLNATTVKKRLSGEDQTDYQQEARQYLQNSSGDLVLLEGAGNLAEGMLFDLSLPQVAQAVGASVLLVVRYQSVLSMEAVLAAKFSLGESLVGVLVNDIPADELEFARSQICPFLEQQNIPVLGMLPKNALLRSVSVTELVKQLQAEVLCRGDRLNLMVESLAIGAMNVNSALKYFRKRRNMAVVTGGDRVEIQLAALESSTHCLILTGQVPPPDFILNKAEELEIPILSVDLDTLSTVEIVDRAFGQVRLHEPVKVECIRQLMQEHFNIERLLSLLGIEAAVALP